MTDIIITANRTDYRLLLDAYLTIYQKRAVYEADAIIDGAAPDEYGNIPVYTLRWEIAEDADAFWEPNWDKPDDVEPCGGSGNQAGYNVESGRLV